jgi:hypothetical protein
VDTITWQQALPLTVLALTGPPSLAVLWGTMVTGHWPWQRR